MRTVCRICSKEFESIDLCNRRGYIIKYCSSRCRHIAGHPSKKLAWKPRPCKLCGKMFVDSTHRKFCSEQCKNTYHNKKKSVRHSCICVYCNKLFRSYYQTSRYCSSKCQGKHMPIPIKILACIDCKQSFEFKGRTSAKRCLPCRAKHRCVISIRSQKKRYPDKVIGVGSGGNQRGFKNHAWNPKSPYHGYIAAQGYTEPYRHKCWQVWEHKCAIPSCGLTRDKIRLDVHHINGVRSDASLSNLVPLCRHHHSKLHKCKLFKPKCPQDYIDRLYNLWPELREIIKCRIKIAELSGDTGTPAIRTEGRVNPRSGATHRSNAATTVEAIKIHEAATPQGENIC